MQINNLDDIKIKPNDPIKKAIAAIEKGLLKVALVINENDKLLGVVNDGDIRRALLKEISVNDPVKLAMNVNFISDKKNSSPSYLYELMRKKSILQIPILKKNEKLTALFVHKSLIKKENQNISNSVVLMAGGIGKRLKPLTNDCPKPMLEVNGEPMLEILVKKLRDSGFKDFFISVNYLKEKIINYFDDGSDWGVKINYLIEDKPLGTAGSLSLLPNNLKEPILIMNADVLTNFDPLHLLKFHKKNKAKATLAVLEDKYQVPFGVVETCGIELSSFKEKPEYIHQINAGIYIIDPEILNFLKKDCEVDMPTLLMMAKEKKQKVIACPIHEYWIDVGVPEKLNLAIKEFKKSKK